MAKPATPLLPTTVTLEAQSSSTAKEMADSMPTCMLIVMVQTELVANV